MLVAKTLEIILASTLTSEIGLQFSKRERSFPFFSMRVITACFWERDILPLVKILLTQLTKGSLIISQNLR